MFKLISIILLIIVCSLMGYFASYRYKKRLHFFNTLILLTNKLSVDINFSRDKLAKVFESFDDIHAKKLYGLKENFLNYLNNNIPLTSDLLLKKPNPIYEDEETIIYSFFHSLGRFDAVNQTKEIENYKKQFEEYKTKAAEDNKKYGSLYFKLGIVLGLFLSILII